MKNFVFKDFSKPVQSDNEEFLKQSHHKGRDIGFITFMFVISFT